jgi:hypothetical protein
VNRLAAAIGCQAPPVIATTSVANAASDGRRIMINFRWFEELVKRHCRHGSCVTSVAVGVLAHELAHHVHCDACTTQRQHAHVIELRADHVAGALMREVGIRAVPSIRTFRPDSKTRHPGSKAPHERGLQLKALVSGSGTRTFRRVVVSTPPISRRVSGETRAEQAAACCGETLPAPPVARDGDDQRLRRGRVSSTTSLSSFHAKAGAARGASPDPRAFAARPACRDGQRRQ